MNRWLPVGLMVLAGCGGPVDLAPAVTGSWSGAVVLSDFTTGRLVPLGGAGGVPTHGDAIVRPRPEGGWLVVNRLGADNLQWVSADWKVEAQVSVGRGTNPQDALPWDGGFWVSQMRAGEIRWWDKGGRGSRVVSLCPSLCDGDGFGEPTFFHREGDRFYVLLQRLDVNKGYVPAGGSRLVEVDGTTARVRKAHLLKFENPVTAFKEWGDEVQVGGAGFRGKLDGGIEAWNLKKGVGRRVIEEGALGGDLVDFVPTGKDTGIAIVDRDGITFLVRYSPRGVKPYSKNLDRAGGFHWLQLVADGEATWLVDRNPSRPGLHRLGDSPRFIGTELPPYWVALP